MSLTPGFDNGNGEWDEYSSYVNSEGLDIGSPVRIRHLFLIYAQFLFVMFDVIYVLLNFFRVFTMKIHLLFSILGMASTHKCLMDHIPQLPHLCLL